VTFRNLNVSGKGSAIPCARQYSLANAQIVRFKHDDVLTLYSSLPALSAALLRELSAPVLYRQPGVPTQPYFWCEDRDQGLRRISPFGSLTQIKETIWVCKIIRLGERVPRRSRC
jgi:hypothetical protein